MIKISHIIIIVVLVLTTSYYCYEIPFKYHTNEELEQVLRDFQKSVKNVNTNLYSIGKTKENNELWVISVTANKTKRVAAPNIKFIGNIHGNEAVGREILLQFLQYLVKNFNTDKRVNWLLKNTIIHILPSLNPDGFSKSREGCNDIEGRLNGDKLDLNRNFPDFFHNTNKQMAKETEAVIAWMKDIPFVLSAGLHSGAVVVNYPFDTFRGKKNYTTYPPSLTPDDDVFKHLARTYADAHPNMAMKRNDSCRTFPEGITNGAEWYSFRGGMQDYNYGFHGCMEITLELSCCKYPNARELKKLWDENRESLISYSEQALKGVTGQIYDSMTKLPIPEAKLQILDRNMTFKSFKTGQYWRILLTGNYKIKVEADGYHTAVQSFSVVNLRKYPELTVLNIGLLNSSYPIPSTTTEEITTKETVANLMDMKGNAKLYHDDFQEPQAVVSSSAIHRIFTCNLFITVLLVNIFFY